MSGSGQWDYAKRLDEHYQAYVRGKVRQPLEKRTFAIHQGGTVVHSSPAGFEEIPDPVIERLDELIAIACRQERERLMAEYARLTVDFDRRNR